MTPRDVDKSRDVPSGSVASEPLSGQIGMRETSASDPIPLPYASRPERVMIEQIEFERHGSWDLFAGALGACVLGNVALGVRGYLQAVFVILLIVPLIPLLRGRTTRMIGAGWLIGLLLMLVGYAVVVWLFRGRAFSLPVSAIEW